MTTRQQSIANAMGRLAKARRDAKVSQRDGQGFVEFPGDLNEFIQENVSHLSENIQQFGKLVAKKKVKQGIYTFSVQANGRCIGYCHVEIVEGRLPKAQLIAKLEGLVKRLASRA